MQIGIKEIDEAPVNLSVGEKRFKEQQENPEWYDMNGFMKDEILARRGYYLEFCTDYIVDVKEIDDYISGRVYIYMNRHDEIIVEDPLDTCRCSWIKTYDDFLEFLITGIMDNTYYYADAVKYFETHKPIDSNEIPEIIERIMNKRKAHACEKVLQVFDTFTV